MFGIDVAALAGVLADASLLATYLDGVTFILPRACDSHFGCIRRSVQYYDAGTCFRTRLRSSHSHPGIHISPLTPHGAWWNNNRKLCYMLCTAASRSFRPPSLTLTVPHAPTFSGMLTPGPSPWCYCPLDSRLLSETRPLPSRESRLVFTGRTTRLDTLSSSGLAALPPLLLPFSYPSTIPAVKSKFLSGRVYFYPMSRSTSRHRVPCTVLTRGLARSC